MIKRKNYGDDDLTVSFKAGENIKKILRKYETLWEKKRVHVV